MPRYALWRRSPLRHLRRALMTRWTCDAAVRLGAVPADVLAIILAQAEVLAKGSWQVWCLIGSSGTLASHPGTACWPSFGVAKHRENWRVGQRRRRSSSIYRTGKAPHTHCVSLAGRCATFKATQFVAAPMCVGWIFGATLPYAKLCHKCTHF